MDVFQHIYIYTNIYIYRYNYYMLLFEVNSYHQGDVMSLRERQGAIPACEPRLCLRNRFQVFFFISQGNQTAGLIIYVKKTPGEKYPSIRGKDPTLRSSPSLIYLLCFPSPYYDPFLPDISERLKHMSPALTCNRKISIARLVKHLVDFGCD